MIVPMKKVYALCLGSDERKVLSALHDIGKVHLIEEDATDEELKEIYSQGTEFSSSYDPRLSQLRHIILFLKSFEEEKKDPIENFVTLKKPVKLSEKEWESLSNKCLENLDKISKDVGELERELDSLRLKKSKLIDLREELFSYKHLPIKLDEFKGTKKVEVKAGSFALPDFEKFNQLRLDKPIGLEILSNSKTTVDVMLFYFRDDKEAEKIIFDCNFEEASFPDIMGYRGTAEEIIKAIDRDVGELERKEAGIIEKAKSLFKKLKLQLYSAYDHLNIIYQQKEGAKTALSSKRTVLVRFWAKAKDVDGIIQKLKKVVDGRIHFVVKDPKEKDKPPVVLENDNRIKPFEIVTRTFSLPDYNNVDPTPYLAPFFFIFTGICLTDAAYGIGLAALSYYMSKRYSQLKNFFTLMMYIGISTAIIGALIGGWMGGLIPIAPLIFDSIKEPITFLMLSLALGFIHVVFGITIKLYENVKKKKYVDALFDQVFWLGLIFSILFIGLGNGSVLPKAVGQLGNYSAIIFTIGLVLTQGRSEKNIIKRLIGGIVSLYDLISYLADVLSYSRLLALGMATAVVGLVINQIAGMAFSIPFIGILIGIAVLIGGHIFNLFINIMSAYIHSSRLQYVEFFSKFFEGGGRRFNPFAKEREYTEVS